MYCVGTSLRTIQKYCAESDGFTWGSLVAWAPFRVRSRIKYRNESKDSEDGKVPPLRLASMHTAGSLRVLFCFGFRL